MKRLVWFFLLVLLIIGCSNENSKIIKVEHEKSAELKFVDSLIFKNTDSLYIGKYCHAEVFDNKIFISDRLLNKVYLFNEKLEYIKTIGQEGKGPGEFADMPFLSNKSNRLTVFEGKNKQLTFYSKRYNFEKEITLPEEYRYGIEVPVFFKDKIYLSASEHRPPLQEIKGSLENFTTAIILDENLKEIKRICPLDEIYDKNREYVQPSTITYSLLSIGFNDFIIINQICSNKYHAFNEKGDLISTYKYNLKHSFPLLKYKLKNYFMDIKKAYEEVYTKMTNKYRIVNDSKNELLLIYYGNLTMDHYYSHSFEDKDNYLAIINKKGKCIFDERIDGELLGVDNGYVYILTEESEKRIVIEKLLLKKQRSNNS